MDWKLFGIFVILNVLNVIIQTVKSIATIKCGKTTAAITNAVAYGLYTVVVVYTVCELPLLWKVAVVAISNLVGVYVVKYLEEKSRKDKMWKVEATVSQNKQEAVENLAYESNLTFNTLLLDDSCLFTFYLPTQADSIKAKKILDAVEAKYFVTEQNATL